MHHIRERDTMRKRTTLGLVGIGVLVVLSGGVTSTAAFATGSHGGGHHPVTICHHGSTLTVDKAALRGHLKHGDTLGACAPVVTPEPTPDPEPTDEPSTPVTEEPAPEPTDEPTTPVVTPDPEPTEEPTTPVVTPEPDPTTPPKPAPLVTYSEWWWDASDVTCDRDDVPIQRGVVTRQYILVDGVWVVDENRDTWHTEEEFSTRPKTAEEIAQCQTTPPTDEPSTTPPTGDPTTPVPSDGPTTPAPGSPSPTAGTTPPASSPTAPAGSVPGANPSTPSTHGSAAPVAADTSRGTVGELAFTGVGAGTLLAGVLAIVVAVIGGAILLVVRTRQRRAEGRR